MAYANCASCGKEIYWRAQRGVRLVDIRCSCGGELRGKTSGQTSKTKGRSYNVCAVCGRRRLHLVALPSERRTWMSPPKSVQAGATVCATHGFEITEAESDRLYPGWHGNPYAYAEARLLAKL